MTEADSKFLGKRISQIEAENAALKHQLQTTEQMLARLQEERIRQLDPEKQIEIISLQQIEALTYHLIRLRKKNEQLLKQVEDAQKIIEEKNREPVKEELTTKKKNDLGLSDLFEADEKELNKTLIGGRDRKVSLEFKEFVNFLARHKRVKITDAALLLDVDRSRVKKWVDFLRSRDFVSGGIEIHSTVVAQPKLNLLVRKLD